MIGNTTMRLGILSLGLAMAGAAMASPTGQGTAAKENPRALAPSVKSYGFVENKGQWGSGSLFYAGAPGINLWVTSKSIKYDYYRVTQPAQWSQFGRPHLKSPAKRGGHVVELEFLGTTGTGTGQGLNAKPTMLNFLYGNGSFRDVRGFGEAKVNSLYGGVDMRVYMDNGAPRYDLIVAAGVNPNQIKFRWNGATGTQIVDANTMAFNTRYGQVSMTDLYTYQMVNGVKVAVQSAFKKNADGTYGFQIGSYDATKPLVIDPVVYSTLFGSFADLFTPGDDFALAVTNDRFGSAYLTGFSNCPRFPITNGAYDNQLLGTDAIVTKFRPDASNLIYSTFIGGDGTEQGNSIAVDSAGRATIVGTTTSITDPLSISFPTTPGAPQETFGGGADDGFVARLAADGRSLDFGTYMGGNNPPFTSEVLTSASADSAGNIYIGGYSASQDFPVTGGVLQPQAGGDYDAVMIRLNSGGFLDYSTFLGGNSTDAIFGLVANAVGEVYATGITLSQNFPVSPGAFDTTVQGQDGFVVKMNPSGTGLEYATLLGGSSADSAVAIAIDTSNSAYVVGSTSSVDFPRTAGAFDDFFNPDFENFVTKLGIDGRSLIYSTFTNSGFTPTGIGVDDLGAAYLVGYGAGAAIGAVTDDPSYNGPALFQFGDGIVMALDEAGSNLIYGSFFGAGPEDGFFGISVDQSRNAYIAGATNSFTNANTVGFPTTPGVFKEQMSEDGAPPFFDAVLMKLKVRATPILQAFGIVPGSVAGTESAVGTITLTGPASPGGAVIRVTSANEAVARPVDGAGNLIDQIVIPEGQTTGTFNVSTSDVVNSSAVQFTAELEGDTARANITVAPWLTNMTLSPNTIVGGNRVTGRVNLFRPAIDGLTVSISTSNQNLAYAVDAGGNRINSFVVPTGQTTATFDILTRGVDAQVSVTLLAKITTPNLQVTRSQVLLIRPASLRSLTMTPNRVNGGQTSTGTVTLDGEVGPTPATFNITQGTTGNPPVSVTLPSPATVTIRRNSTNVEIGKSGQFTVTAGVPTANSFRNIVATRATDAAQTRTSTLFVDFNEMVGINLSSNNVVGGTVVVGSVTLRNPSASGGFALKVTTSDSVYAPINGSRTELPITIPAGAIRSADFNVNTRITRVAKTITITASKPGFASRTATIAMRPLLFTMTIAPNNVVGGSAPSIGTVTFSDDAPVNVAKVTLTSSDTTAVTVPAFVRANEGERVVTFNVNTKSVTANKVVTVTGSLATLPTAVVRTATITVRPLLLGLTLSPSALVGGNNSTGSLLLSDPAGPAGVNITLSSNNSNAQVPASATIPAGGTTATFTVRTTMVATNQAAVITARTPAGVTATASLTINALGITVILSPTAVTGGPEDSSLRVRLSAPAAAQTPVTLTSSNSAVARAVLNTVNIAAGATESASVRVDTNSVATDTNVTLTAILASGRTGSAVLTVRQPRVASVSLLAGSVIGGNSVSGRVNLNAAAPASGLPVQLSSSNTAAAQVPASVTVPGGTATTTFLVTTSVVSVDTDVTITARTANVTATTTLTVLAPTLVSLTLNPSTLIGGNNSVGTVTIDRVAPAGGITLTLAKSPTATGSPFVTIPATVTIPAGSRTATFTITTTAVSRTVSTLISARYAQRDQEVNAVLTLLAR